MKKIFLFTMMMSIVLAFSSCSSDDDDPAGTNGEIANENVVGYWVFAKTVENINGQKKIFNYPTSGSDANVLHYQADGRYTVGSLDADNHYVVSQYNKGGEWYVKDSKLYTKWSGGMDSEGDSDFAYFNIDSWDANHLVLSYSMEGNPTVSYYQRVDVNLQ